MASDPVAALRLPLDRLPDPLPIPVIGRPFQATIRPPGSKSLTNRALLLAALADGTSTLHNALVDADDAQVMVRAIRQLGAAVEHDERDPTTVRVKGVNGRWRVAPEGVTLDLHNAGTATRFLAAAALLAPPGSAGITIDGDARMRQRPIAELVDALRNAGATVDYLSGKGFPPVKVRPARELCDSPTRTLTFARTASSQFISALFMVQPLTGMRSFGFRFTEPLTSEPYLHMTLKLMRRLGFEVRGTLAPGDSILIEAPHHWSQRSLPGFDLLIEPDASGAAPLLAAAALVPSSRVAVPGLTMDSLQGDVDFARILALFGAMATVDRELVAVQGSSSLRRADIDLADVPDTAMTAASLACFADGPSTLHGLRTLRVKETDRLAALQTELTKLGAAVEIFADGADEALRITPPPGGIGASAAAPPVHFDTYHDHRMAMSLALVGLRRPNVFIRDPGCVRKTYPTFWQDLATLYQ